ncbi:MAG TPA: hypothetical protein PKN33_02905 [Phycisphaerae bacterium]|nr:hypothetical protein [Phycisphaerae bacterium]
MKQTTFEKRKETNRESSKSSSEDEPESKGDRIILGLPQILRLVAVQKPNLHLNAFEEWSLYQ